MTIYFVVSFVVIALFLLAMSLSFIIKKKKLKFGHGQQDCTVCKKEDNDLEQRLRRRIARDLKKLAGKSTKDRINNP